MADEERKRKALHKKMEKVLDQVRAHPTTPLDLNTAVTLQERAEAFMISCEDVHFKLVTTCADEAALEVQETAFEPIENTFVEITSKLKGIMKELSPTSTSTGGSSGSLHVKLPTIELPTFDGTYADWPSFFDLFKATVDSNSQLAPSQKLQYLKRALQNEPATLIKSFTVTDAHYTEALQLLKDRNQGGSSASSLKTHHVSSGTSCLNCSGDHPLYKCQEFLSKTPTERSSVVWELNLCFNCIQGKHRAQDCLSKGVCKKCHKHHHTLLHEEWPQRPTINPPRDQGVPPKETSATPGVQSGEELSSDASVQSHHAAVYVRSLLKTAIASVQDIRGTLQPVRIFLDDGSDGTLITEDCVKRLGLKRRHSRTLIGGVGKTTAGVSKGIINAQLSNRSNLSFSLSISAHVMESVTDHLPRVELKNEHWAHIEGLDLADPQWFKPSDIDILLGMDFYNDSLLQGFRKGAVNTPSAQNTIFGWVLSGPTETATSQPTIRFHHTTTDVDQTLRRFWEVEELPRVRILTKEEKIVEEHFRKNFSRDVNGHFIVGVPFNTRKKDLGGSRAMAVKRWLSTERRLVRSPSHYQQYRDFMYEYEALGHMEKINPAEPSEQIGKTYHLPHHHVINEGSSTTKLRVVFDGSARTTTGVSLNETLYVGATLQDDLFDLLLRFRLHPIVIKADITKMFRQFRLRKEDADFHRILWRESPQQPLQDYRLLTVTYGTACAPNLSTRCLQQLALDCKQDYPLASKALHDDTYVDDVMTTTTTANEAIQLYQQLSSAVATAGLQLRKWSTNDPIVLAAIPEQERETSLHSFESNETIKALGVQWCPSTDNFTFKCAILTENKLTKRVLLSDLSKVFDPLGFLSCVTVRAKIQMQELWKLQIGWDDEVPSDTQVKWKEYQDEMKSIPLIRIPREITSGGACNYQLHGFSDSSTIAYGCVIYLRAVHPDGSVSVNFVTSKTRVAPLKQITLPRLELMSACELSELIDHVKQTLAIDCEVWCWSDSTITLKWIASSPRRWQTFVANRVATIQQHTEVEWWKHVPGIQNPADLASRGVPVSELTNNTFWFQGPEWLSQQHFPNFPMNTIPKELSLEENKVYLMCHHLQVNTSITERFSSLIRLKRVSAHILRLFHNAKNPQGKLHGPLTVTEIEVAFMLWVRRFQQQAFGEDIHHLQGKIKLPHKSKLHDLFPYIDGYGVLRVGGRLQHAKIPEDQKHLIILPSDSHLTNLIVQHYHEANFHGGFQLTWSTLQTKFWIFKGRDKVRHYIRKFVVCRRHRVKVAEQLMGSLPSPRIVASRPFLHVGVDYAGPFVLKNPIGRAPKTYKAYMCLFVCMATKAIHLEAVSALTTAAFIDTLRRFVARRGLPAHLYSDCGTNFVGAEKELQQHIRTPSHQQQVENELASQGIQFHFNPPSSPHHGGLWEAGVKSAKHHLRRVVGIKVLTYEVFSTFLCQVEAILNSRPLHPLSPDPNDLNALTPGHFLIGEALTTIPEVDIREFNENRLSMFQQQQYRLQHFWHRWSNEYLNTLQQRNKWKWEQNNVQVGDLALIKEDTGVQQWRMGRVIEVHPGSDGSVRVVTLRTSNGQLQRPIVKLIPLLTEN